MLKISFTKSKIFLACCLFFIIGIAVASFSPKIFLNPDLYWFALAMILFVLLILFFKKRNFRITLLWGLFFCLAVWRYAISLPIDGIDKIWHYNEQKVVFSGVVIAEPDIRSDNIKLKIKSESISGISEKISGQVLVTANLYPRYDYGDRLEIACELKQPEEFSGFAYDRYLARYDIYSVCYYPKITLLEKNQGNRLYGKIFQFKAGLYKTINRGLTGQEASIAGPIILGGQQGVNEDLRDAFSRTGLTHIMAVSGSNISILAGIVLFVFLGLGLDRKYSFYGSVAFLIIYVILVGSPASAVRAGVMGFLVLWALYLGRLNKITNALAFAAALMLLFNPRLLRDDVGFQLSFGAILGLVYCYPIIDRWLESVRIPRLWGARDVVGVTLAAQIFTLPIIAYNFSQISIISPLANLLILWTIPVLMAVILVALLLGFIFPGFSFLFFFPAWLILKYIIFTVESLARFRYATIEVEYLWWGWVIVYYVIIIAGIIKINKTNAKQAL